jgi:hypothetical protein
MNGTILSNFLLCKNGSGKISQNFAKLNSLPKFREIRTKKFREIVETHFRGHPMKTLFGYNKSSWHVDINSYAERTVYSVSMNNSLGRYITFLVFY